MSLLFEPQAVVFCDSSWSQLTGTAFPARASVFLAAAHRLLGEQPPLSDGRRDAAVLAPGPCSSGKASWRAGPLIPTDCLQVSLCIPD